MRQGNVESPEFQWSAFVDVLFMCLTRSTAVLIVTICTYAHTLQRIPQIKFHHLRQLPYSHSFDNCARSETAGSCANWLSARDNSFRCCRRGSQVSRQLPSNALPCVCLCACLCVCVRVKEIQDRVWRSERERKITTNPQYTLTTLTSTKKDLPAATAPSDW